MKEVPMLFSTPIVKAIKEGKKILTSRLITKRNSICNTLLTGDGQGWHSFDFNDVVIDGKKTDYEYLKVAVPENGTRHRIFSKIEVGDVIWVKETWRELGGYDSKPDYSIMSARDFTYKADEEWNGPWKPSIFMPKSAARIKLKVEHIYAERVQHITEEHAQMEGVERCWVDIENKFMLPDTRTEKLIGQYGSYKNGFESIWIAINGIKSWNDNPFVWRYKFSII